MKKLWIILVFLLITFSAKGATYYVATDGGNENPGTLLQPWATITYAMSESSPVEAGDTIFVEAGNYGTEQVIFAKSGTAINRIVIQGYKTTPGDQPKDDDEYSKFSANITFE
jgi:hypothetical protein